MRIHRACAALPAAFLCACGGGSPTGPGGGGPTSPTYDVVAVVFYDENGNGVLDAGEAGRLPQVEVEIGGRVAKSEPLSGRVVVHGVPAGAQSARIHGATLPPYYAAGAPVSVTVPQAAGMDVLLAATLPIAPNEPNVYMGFGDSITVGDGSSDGLGYRGLLQSQLVGYFGLGIVANEGKEATRSPQGANRIDGALDYVHPAYTLILYGTNDWNDEFCKNEPPCYTIDSLRSIVDQAKAARSLPVLGTIPPANTGYSELAPPDRNVWVAQMNNFVRDLAHQEGAPVADMESVFLKAGNLASLFSDHVHPNDAGYQLMAGEWFRAITQAAGGSSTATPTALDTWSFRAVPDARALPSVRRGTAGHLPGARPRHDR